MSVGIKSQRRSAVEAMGRIRHLHFVGVGGSGMNGIAQVMLKLGFRVSGSDIKRNAAIERLVEEGATVGANAVFAAVTGLRISARAPVLWPSPSPPHPTRPS